MRQSSRPVAFVVQGFARGRDGLVSTGFVPAASAGEAMLRARALAARQAGALALRLSGPSGIETVTRLAAFGAVPEPTAPSLSGG